MVGLPLTYLYRSAVFRFNLYEELALCDTRDLRSNVVDLMAALVLQMTVYEDDHFSLNDLRSLLK